MSKGGNLVKMKDVLTFWLGGISCSFFIIGNPSCYAVLAVIGRYSGMSSRNWLANILLHRIERRMNEIEIRRNKIQMNDDKDV